MSSKQQINEIVRTAMLNYNYKKAIQDIEKILKKHPILRDEQRLCDLGMLYDHQAMVEKNVLKRKEYEKTAFKLYREILTINPGSMYDSYALWGIGRIWLHRKNKKALKYAKEAAVLTKKMTGKAGGMLLNVGLVYDELGNYKQAERWYLKTIKEDPGQLGLYINLTTLYFKYRRLDRLKKILPTLKKLYEKEPDQFKQTKWGEFINGKIKEMYLKIKIKSK
ncbi:MAG: hypothetical protein HYV76_02075 [Candidatus Vogelbacteria bacterium]|nr:hypothetical protein [Candidatus Vogelbacteria bacterium]